MEFISWYDRSFFLKLQKCVSLASVSLNVRFDLSDTEIALLNNIVETLKPLKLCLEALCRRDATLLSADGILKFLMDELNRHNSPLSTELRDAVYRRVKDRRNSLLFDLMSYLNNPNKFTVTEVKLFFLRHLKLQFKRQQNLCSRGYLMNLVPHMKFIQANMTINRLCGILRLLWTILRTL